jgi:hypothetical protein
MRQRKNLNYLPTSELELYRAAVLRLQNLGDRPGSFSDFAKFHFQNCGGVHSTRLFLPWHRALVDRFEQALRADASTKDVTIPYWDWWQQDVNQDIPAAFADDIAIIGGRPVPNPLKPPDVQRFTPAARQPIADYFPIEDKWNQKLAMTTGWPAFGGVGTHPSSPSTGFVESFHNGVHSWVGNTMSQVSKAAADPIFWSHHSFVDYLWWTNQPARQLSGAELQDQLPGFGLTTGDVVPIGSLDYEYVVTSANLPRESVPSDGAVLLQFPRDLPPDSYRAARLTIRVTQFPKELSSLKIYWGQDLERSKTGRPAQGFSELNTTLSLFGAAMEHHSGGHEPAMHGFNQVVWLSRAEVEGLRRNPKPNIPLTIFGFDSQQRRVTGAIDLQSVEFAFLP